MHTFLPNKTYIKLLLAFITVAIIFPGQAYSQFMRIELAVECEFGVRNLTVPMQDTNSGVMELLKGSLEIYASENTELFVTVIPPGELVMNSQNRLPLELHTKYLPGGENSLSDATAITAGSIRLHKSNKLIDYMQERSLPLRSTLFFSGSVYPDNLDQGIYQGEVVLIFEYL